MRQYSSVEEFIESPNTVDFITRRSEYFDQFVKSSSDIVLTQTLAGRYVIGYIDRANFNSLFQTLGTGFISSASLILGLLDIANLEASGIIQVQQQPYLNLTGRGVIVGIVDTGIDYTLDVFKYEDGTSKIQYIYDQTGRGDSPLGFLIGAEYTNAQINEALQSENPYDIVPQRDTVGHGTFLASLAAGRETTDFVGAAPDSELIVVKLRGARPFYREMYLIPPEQENAYESSAVMVGIDYILTRARELDRPVVICLGLGTNFGSHDGYSVFEEYLSGISSLRGVCVCTAAGNEAQSRHHIEGKVSATETTSTIELKVGDTSGDAFISIWNNISDRLSVSIRSPTGELIERVPAKSGSVLDTKLILENSRVTVNYYFPVEGSGGQLTAVRIIDATPGIWNITLHGDIILDGTYHAWLPITGFIAPDIEFLESSPYYTVVVPSTMMASISCGAYNTANNSLYVRSSWGPTRAMVNAPDLVAPGVNVGAYYPTGYGSMTGTSVATAIVAGASALLMQWGIVDGNDSSISTYQIKAYLIRGCTRTETLSYPNNQWGYGRLNLLRTFTFMRDV
ncbi:S8 family peptidase [Clostridium aminobutyricum]|uniref:S8 family peptidase n=1 Tax=Clostridium aminobutyricum TaxID=33953 RepID=A0A939DC25_CLOAM|nr:S8 family peptidase [Clostridium aminobutyricum]MBN7774533.1 S8 family peptidase [Clostridium aminobutyricum]